MRQQAFLGVLDEYNLEQFLTRRSEIASLLDLSLRLRAEAEGAGDE